MEQPEELVFDPRCESYAVALQSLFKLFLRRRFDELKEVGVTDLESLQVWALTCSDLKTHEEMFRLLSFYPELVGSIIILVGLYQLKVKESRRSYYRV